MGDITKSASAGGVDFLKHNGETRQALVSLENGDAVYIDANGRLAKAVSTVFQVTGSASAGWTAFDGIAARDIPSGTFGEIYGNGVEFFYADSGLTIGSAVWTSATAGKLADAKVAGNDNPVAVVRSATTIQLIRGVG